MSLKHCVTMMQRLLPTLLLVWIDHGADEDWGPMCYPPMTTVRGTVFEGGRPRSPEYHATTESNYPRHLCGP